MKKSLVFLSFLFISYTLKAQKISVQAGANFANITNTKSGNVENNKTLTTLNAGLIGNFKLSPAFSIAPGLLFTGKGSKTKTTFTDKSYVTTKFNPYYIELPVDFVFHLPLDTKNKFFISAGPYIAVGVGGKSISDLVVGDVTTTIEREIEYNNDNPFTSQQEDAAYYKLKRFDYGLNVGAGIILNSFLIKLNYGYGLSKINSTQNDNNDDDLNKYRTISLSVGIPLNGF